MSTLIVRSLKASMNSLLNNFRYSASFVCPMITSSISVCGNFFGLILCLALHQVSHIRRFIELENLNKFYNPAIRDIEFTIEVFEGRSLTQTARFSCN